MKSTKIILTLSAALVVAFAAGMFAVATGLPFAVVALAFGAGSLVIGKGMKFSGVAFDIITGTPITFNGKEARSGIIDPAYQSPEIAEFLTIINDIVAQEQIAFLGRITKITKIDEGCGTGAINKDPGITAKYWNPVAVKAWLTQCEKDLERTFYVYTTAKGIDRLKVTEGDFADYVMEIMTTALKEDALRLIWFGDTAADTIALGSFLNAGTDIPFYNAINGYWKQIFAAVTGATMTRVTISENAGGSYAAQALAAGKSVTVFRSLQQNADPRLKSDPNRVILCTTSLLENYVTYLESQNLDTSLIKLENGYQTVMFRGIKIYAIDFWDRQINSDMNDGTAWVIPHRAVMTTKANMMVGMDASDKVAEVKAFFDDVTEINHFKAGYKLDVKILHDFMCIAAY